MDRAIRAAVEGADSSQATANMRTMERMVFNSVSTRRVLVGLLGLFGVIAVLLAVSGVYGVIAYMVAQRTNEIGIRIALGADPRQVRRLVIRHGAILIGLGLVAGVGGAVAAARVIQSSLFGISRTDPLTYALGIALLGGIGLLACYLPARRASRIDPMLALRHE